MAVLLGITAYLGLAVLLGRFFSLSTRGTVIYSGTSPAVGRPERQRPSAPPKRLPAVKPEDQPVSEVKSLV